MKEQTIFNVTFKEAKEKGFKSEVLISYIGNNIFNNTTLKLLYYTELQKWLREEHDILIYVDPKSHHYFQYHIITDDDEIISSERSDNWAGILEKGLQEALKLI